MARPARPERSRSARSSRQLSRFYHSINLDRVFGTHRWLELCAVWCCGGWRSGSPRFSKLANEGARIFNESLSSEEKRLTFRRSLMECLWERRDSTALLHGWLDDIKIDVVGKLLEDS